MGCNTGNYAVAEVAEDMRVLKKWFDSGVLKARDEKDFERVGLDDAIEKGYRKKVGGNQVVIAML